MYLKRPLLTRGLNALKTRPRLGRTMGRRVVAVASVLALTAGASILATAPASAAYVVSTSQGKFLGGSAAGINLDTLVALQDAEATNTGTVGTVSQSHPLSATALNAITVDLGSGIHLLGQNGILTLGAVNQYAAAKSDGSSLSASGAVTNTGAIGVGGQAGVPQANATLDLTSVLGPTVTGTVSNLHVNVGSLSAVATQAAGANGAQTGDYNIASLNLALTSPALKNTTSSLRATLVGLQPTVDGLQDTIDGLVPGIVTVHGLPNLGGLVDNLTTVTSADGSITANLQTGAITIDVAKLLTAQGLDINNLPADTQLTPYITTALTTELLPAVVSALTGLETQITHSLQNLTLTVLGFPVQLGTLLQVVAPVITTVTAPIDTVISNLGTTLITPLASALTGVVSLQANVQETSGGVFTERALQLGVVPGLNPLALVNLASASVGPNAGPAGAPTATTLNPTHGPAAGGTTVTITGTGFDGSSTVSIGGFGPITPTTLSDDGKTLTFVTPPHAEGDVPVVVTTIAGSTPPLTYTYDSAVPTATSLSPNHGPAAGGTAVTVHGTGFDASSTVAVGGFGPITPTTIAPDGTSLTFTTPAHAAGGTTVVVTTPGGSTGPLAYTYDPAVAVGPTATSLNPDHGPVAGGTSVTVTGTGFDGSSTVTVGGFGPITPTSIAPDGTSVTFTTPAHAAGGVPVVVTTTAGSTDPLTYTFVTPPPVAPTAASLAPTHGSESGGTTVTVTGANFGPSSTVSVDGVGPITPTSIAPDGTSLTFTTPAHAPGGVSVVVTTTAGSTAPLTYTFDADPVGAPTATSLDPTHGPTAGNTSVTVTGTGFDGTSTVSVDGSAPITPTAIAGDGTSVTFDTPAHAPGAVLVTVTTDGGTTGPLTFTYDAPAPTASGLSPNHGPVAGGTDVTITGTGFDASSRVSVDGSAPITPTSVSNGGTTLHFTTPAHTAGGVNVTVTGTAGTTDPLVYTYDPLPAPTASGLTPDHGPVAGGTDVTITGTGFDASSRVSLDGSAPITPTSVSNGGTTLHFTTPAHTAGGVSVTVTGTTGTTDPLDYTYDPAPAPTVSGLTPNHGPIAGGTDVTITGTGFDASTRVSVDGSGPITPTSVSNGGTTLHFTTPAHAVGGVNVNVTGTTGTAGPLGYTYDPAPAPTASGLTPDHGPVAGGTDVTITGTGFDASSRVYVDGAGPITPTSVASNGTSLTFVTPPHIVAAVPITVTTTSGTTGPVTYTYVPTTAGGSPSAPGSDPAAVLAFTGTSATPALILAMLLMLAGLTGVGVSVARRVRDARAAR